MDPANTVVDEVFSQLSPADEQVLVALPYRIGLYVSFADVTGGWEAQETEMKSLTSILQQFSQDFYKTEFTQKVLMDTLQARSSWAAWSKNIDAVPAEGDAIIEVLKTLLMPDELHAFKTVLMDIAMTVAMAFRENAGQPVDKVRPLPVVRDILSRMMHLGPSVDPMDHINISDDEKSALRALFAAMDYQRT